MPDALTFKEKYAIAKKKKLIYITKKRKKIKKKNSNTFLSQIRNIRVPILR